ncbi:DUF3188 domain-containing protein [Prochlorococcus marinus]|uniref:DUF3188 domain-containing protein n=1 Tax=Prochlorococcus marinus TaxID=1219 RepID=UPI0022B4DF13|nr:DUF3188 domain-containing protein [Prochlorococcus marinus]
MRFKNNSWLSFAAPLLVFIAIFGFLNRKGNDRIQAVPALLIGIGLSCSSAIGRNIRRKKLLTEILHIKNHEN